ncbi:hypothetical protein LSAT2_015730 [Lamellibrachia satsuma]|nr:hypothetical protein LSAT2_015730 [Lamellibrachia satsuma]
MVIAWVLCPDPVKSQCTSEYCRDSEDEPGLRTMVSRVLDSMEMLQQQMTKQEELIRSMKDQAIIMWPKCESSSFRNPGVTKNLPNFCSESYQYALKGDFNGDGRIDILCHDYRTGRKWIYYGSNDGYSAVGWDKEMGWCHHNGASLYIGDFNGDSRDDMLCHDTNGYTWIAYADIAGQFTGTGWERAMNYCKCAECKLCIGDFDGDGKSDMFCDDRKRILYATANGNFD